MATSVRLKFGASVNRVDTVAPTVTSATIDAEGDLLTVVCSKPVRNGGGATTGWALSTGETLGTPSITGSTITFTISPVVVSGAAPTLAYTQPGNGVESTPNGIDLATFSGTSVTNNSTVTSGQAFSDTFSGTLSNWTTESGSWSISSGTLRQGSTGWAMDRIRYNTACSTVNQYVKYKLLDTNGGYSGAWLRASSGATTGYYINARISEGTFTFAGTTTAMPGGIANGDVFGVTITGTGASTVVRVWKNPTGLPTSASNWNGDSTPDIEFTNDPSPAYDSGLYVGLAAHSNSGAGQDTDDFFGGDCPVVGGEVANDPMNYGAWGPLGGNWETLVGGLGAGGTDGFVGATVGQAWARWSGAGSFNANQYSEITVAGAISGGHGAPGAVVRAVPSATSWYYARMYAATAKIELYRYASSTSTLITDVAHTFAAGHKLRLEVTGTGSATRLTVKKDTGGGWVDVITSVDPGGTYIDSGNPGIFHNNPTDDSLLDYWAGGNL
jgi:hypothetical protein